MLADLLNTHIHSHTEISQVELRSGQVKVPAFMVGGLPSNTYTGLMPTSSMRQVRVNIPCRWLVTSPSAFVSWLSPLRPIITAGRMLLATSSEVL